MQGVLYWAKFCIIFIVMRKYVSIAARNNMHLVLYRYCCNGRYCVEVHLKCLEGTGGIWSWQESGHCDTLQTCKIFGLRWLVHCGNSKVETIGDAYSCASGVPVRNPNHAAELADMALALRVAVTEFKVCTHSTVYEGSFTQLGLQRQRSLFVWRFVHASHSCNQFYFFWHWTP